MEGNDNNKEWIIPVFGVIPNKRNTKLFLPVQINQKNKELNKLYLLSQLNDNNNTIKVERRNTLHHRCSSISSRKNDYRSTSESKLNEKINFGSLTYLSFKENENNNNIRSILHQKEILLNSNNFVINGKDLNQFNMTTTTFNNILSPHKTPIKKTSLQKPIHSSADKNNTDQNRVLRYQSHNKNISLLSLSNISLTNRSGTKSYSCNSERPLHLSRSRMNIKKIFKEKLNEKINSLDTERVHNLKKLFTLIDKTKNIHNKKITIDLKKDIEEILEVKVKEKNEKTKDDFMQAVHLKDGNYFSMGGVKAKMLNLSDKINKITDDEALIYAERIAEEYMKSSKQAGINTFHFGNGLHVDLNGNRYKETFENNNIRRKIGLNNKKIQRLKMKITQDQLKMVHRIENIINSNNRNNTSSTNNITNANPFQYKTFSSLNVH